MLCSSRSTYVNVMHMHFLNVWMMQEHGTDVGRSGWAFDCWATHTGRRPEENPTNHALGCIQENVILWSFSRLSERRLRGRIHMHTSTLFSSKRCFHFLHWTITNATELNTLVKCVFPDHERRKYSILFDTDKNQSSCLTGEMKGYALGADMGWRAWVVAFAEPLQSNLGQG